MRRITLDRTLNLVQDFNFPLPIFFNLLKKKLRYLLLIFIGLMANTTIYQLKQPLLFPVEASISQKKNLGNNWESTITNFGGFSDNRLIQNATSSFKSMIFSKNIIEPCIKQE